MNQADKFNVEILADGTFKITTDPISAANHVNADNFVREMFRHAGGPVEIRHRHGDKKHVHHFANANEVVLDHGHKH